MPELTESELKTYQQHCAAGTIPAPDILRSLSALYARFEENARHLARLEHNQERQKVESGYAQQKQQFQLTFTELKKQYKQVDNRIISVEQ
ncbi:MAG TPA: hypothetical protein VKB19_02260, partial [Pedobacter sp.]|nr:hypothetical protein [Pedobacter sp.]